VFWGKLPEARYAALDAQYAKEQGALSEEITGLEAAALLMAANQ
jgi:hypothetical protein